MQKKTSEEASLDLGELRPIPAPEPPSDEVPTLEDGADIELMHQCPPVEYWTPANREDIE